MVSRSHEEQLLEPQVGIHLKRCQRMHKKAGPYGVILIYQMYQLDWGGLGVCKYMQKF